MRRFLFVLPFVIMEIASAEEPPSAKSSPFSSWYEKIDNELSLTHPSGSIYLQFNTNGLYPSLTDWKNQLHLSDGSHPSGTNTVFGAQAGFVLDRYVQGGIGYEFFFTTKVATAEASGDHITSRFFYGTARGTLPLESVPGLSLIGTFDVGILSATEAMENYYGSDYNKTGSTTAFRSTVGAQYYMTENWSVIADAGYLDGKNKDAHRQRTDLASFLFGLLRRSSSFRSQLSYSVQRNSVIHAVFIQHIHISHHTITKSCMNNLSTL